MSTILSDASSGGGSRVCFPDGVWVEQSLNVQPSFREIVTTHYNASLASVDFQTKALEVTNEVNLWAEKETNGLIKELLPLGSVDSLTRLVFANALYFKGAWEEKFDASMTRDHDFHLLNGTSVNVPFMVSKKKQFLRAFDGFKVLRLFYKRGGANGFSMYFFLPDAKDGLSALVEQVTSGTSKCGFKDKLICLPVEVGDFRIPKFKFSFDFEASHVLKELGVVLPFSHDADLTKMVDSAVGRGLFVSKIFHKSFIEVNEEGTEAAAASSMEGKKCIQRPLDFIADHPFLFMIREDRTRTILFTGQMLNPLAG